MSTGLSKSARVRSRLTHPDIDSDGHTIEFQPAVMDYLKQVGGAEIAERYRTRRGAFAGAPGWFGMNPEQRRERRATVPPWWALPTRNTLDRATAMLPKLLYQRLDEMGLDLTVVYPSLGLGAPHIADDEVRAAVCRAFNSYHADVFREFRDRIIPVAVIPMHTPAEAIAELEFAVRKLGMKAIMMAGYVYRPLRADQEVAGEGGRWMDTFCLDSEYDYDPVWAKCEELGVAPTFHSASMGWGSRTSISNYMYNHIGHFGEAGEAICKALFFGGVIRRFPRLKFAFLEGGVSTGARIYNDLIARWKKRNPRDLENYNPANLNVELLVDLFRRYGNFSAEQLAYLSRPGGHGARMAPEQKNDFLRAGVASAEEIRDQFIPHFYFGCEADDPMNSTGFNRKANAFGVKVRAIFSSDIGHWDVPDMTEVTEEAYELVEHGMISEEDFREFVFVNPVSLWTGTNPEFFKGTVVEDAVKGVAAESA
ncbi:MAG TPA: amidohydrolase family protein [Candidatus Binataceae bacterium]|nr:amidohydrolase family protein [Candidatus Binataceae bacterium]